MKSNILYIVMLMSALFLASCGKDPVDTKKLAVNFEVTKVDDLTVTFTNKSSEAKSYAWSFGDGSTSTDKNPKHTYAKGGTYKVTLTAKNDSKSKSASKNVVVANKYKKTGYLVVSVASSSAGSTYYAGYYDKQPSGDIDLTTKQSFQRARFVANHGGYLYGWPTDNTPGLSKFAVDGKTNQLVTVHTLPLVDFPNDVTIINDELGFMSSFSSTTITTFNPMTMKVTGTVDMSGARPHPTDNDRNGYNSITYNKVTGKLYATAYTNSSSKPPFYDAEDVWVEVINPSTKKREKTIIHPNAKYPLIRGTINTIIDESGNTYLLCQGSYGIDGKLGPQAPAGSRPQIIKINTNSEFETDYALNPVNQIGFTNNFFQLYTSMVYAGNNKVYGIGTSEADSPEILALLQKFAAGTLTTQEYQQLQFLVIYSENMSIIETDLNTKTSKIIANTKTAGFAYPAMYNYDGKVISQITGNGGKFNGFYAIDPSNSSASPLFNISSGGLATHLIDISKEF